MSLQNSWLLTFFGLDQIDGPSDQHVKPRATLLVQLKKGEILIAIKLNVYLSASLRNMTLLPHFLVSKHLLNTGHS